MKNPIFRPLLILGLLFIQFAGAETFIKVGQIKGNAFIRREKGIETTAKLGDVLNRGDTIRTESLATVLLTLSDGSVMRVGPESKFQVNEAEPLKWGWVKWIFSLGQGSVRAFVSKSPDPNLMRLKIKTEHAAMGVRGTEFYISTSQTGTRLYTFSGVVRMAATENKLDNINEAVEVAKKEFSEVKERAQKPSSPRPYGLEETKDQSEVFTLDFTPEQLSAGPNITPEEQKELARFNQEQMQEELERLMKEKNQDGPAGSDEKRKSDKNSLESPGQLKGETNKSALRKSNASVKKNYNPTETKNSKSSVGSSSQASTKSTASMSEVSTKPLTTQLSTLEKVQTNIKASTGTSVSSEPTTTPSAAKLETSTSSEVSATVSPSEITPPAISTDPGIDPVHNSGSVTAVSTMMATSTMTTFSFDAPVVNTQTSTSAFTTATTVPKNVTLNYPTSGCTSFQQSYTSPSGQTCVATMACAICTAGLKCSEWQISSLNCYKSSMSSTSTSTAIGKPPKL